MRRFRHIIISFFQAVLISGLSTPAMAHPFGPGGGPHFGPRFHPHFGPGFRPHHHGFGPHFGPPPPFYRPYWGWHSHWRPRYWREGPGLGTGLVIGGLVGGVIGATLGSNYQSREPVQPEFYAETGPVYPEVPAALPPAPRWFQAAP